MGKKSQKKQKIPYYYMSIQYGICHGVLDSINQVFVKEKEVFCGEITGASNVYVNQPDLFGGETKEGGVDGVIECYFGTEDQKMTNIAATRFGKTSETMPGYRGVAMLFFRGYDDSELGSRPAAGSGTSGRGFFAILMSALGPIFGAVNNYVPQGGFGWIVNNPYLPSAWAHVTRIGKPFGPTWAKIGQPLGGGSGVREGTFAGYYNSFNSTMVDVSDLATAIDAGLATFTFEGSGYASYTGLGGSGPAPFVLTVEARPRNEAGGLISPPNIPGEDDWQEVQSAEGGLTISMSRTPPPGTRTIEVWSRIVPSFPIFSSFGHSGLNWDLVYTSLGPTLCEDTDAIGSPPDMNPAFIIAECLTNRQWGMGAPISGLDTDSFLYAAEYLFNEYFGLSMMWNEQTTIEKFIMEVLDHIQAMLFINPKTGLWTLRLIRGDYDVETLRTLDELNCTVRNRQRKGEGEIINEIIISYTNFQNEEEKTVTFHDLAGIAQRGEIISDTRNYYGIRQDYTASVVGGRDIRSASYPIFSADVEANRSFRDVLPGDVLKMSVPEDGITGMVVRVSKVDYGSRGDSKVRFAVTEDIFGLPATTYSAAAVSLWESPDQAPDPLSRQRIIDVPLPVLLRSGYTTNDISDSDYPSVITAVLGDDPGQSVDFIELWGPEVRPNGSTVIKTIGRVTTTPTALLDVALVPAVTSTLSGLLVRGAARPAVVEAGDFLYLDGDDANGEFVMLDTYNSGTDTWTIVRALFDTIPHDWPIGTVLWYIGPNLLDLDPGESTVGLDKTYTLLPRTGGGTLSPDDAVPIVHTPTERGYAPMRPANAQLDGGGFAEKKHSQFGGTIPVNVVATWATRNRLQEDGVASHWDDAAVTPEAGQTTTLRVLERSSQALVATYSGLTGNSFNIPTVDLIDYRFYDVQFMSERDGFTSIQYATRLLDLERLGYGNNYGYDYGENNGS